MGYMVNYLLEKFSILRLDCAKEIKIIFIMEEIENMKDFFKWLGVNEKVAKVVIWIFIFMVFLIVTNAMLESLGFPYYKITAENLSKLNSNKIIECISSWIMVLFSFYSVIFLVFRIKDYKKIFKYSIIYLILNIIVTLIGNYIIAQLFVILYTVGFCYFYSNKKWKYLLYGIISLIINVTIQYVCYIYKIQYIDYSSINFIVRTLLSLDYFIIMGIIILVKEIYLKKRSDNK